MFKQLNSSTVSFDEIVFEHRNKSYGAFQIRKEYEKNLLTGFAIIAALFTFVVASIYIEYLRAAPNVVHKVFEPVVGEMLDKKIFEMEFPEAPKKKAATVPPAGRKDLNKEELPPTPDPDVSKQENKKEESKTDVDSLAFNAQGNNEKGDVSPISGDKGSETGSTNSSGINPNTPSEVAEVMPEYPGGIENMYAFLSRNLRYPRDLKTRGISGTVFVSFVVNSKGDINDIEVIKSPNEGFNDEVVRVIKKMPAWKPGIQSGVPVSVRFRMPVKFTIR
jgi:protein TonB